ncbi:MAG: carotenoid 1,2-hydratase [Methylacidiphilales bacterium]|nr:carotenoid 1,2-hydratase [Candidatus Methylacidiphilales bacterium]MDW8348889.1 lipocalin-like domain-containing protein [Verrucomicrobiae bacterium]
MPRTRIILILPLVQALLDSFIPTHAQTHTQWKQALSPHPWSFPKDHGNHPEYRTEWWYFTGNLTDSKQKNYGYQLTFFRQGARRDTPPLKSRWTFRDLYFAHFAISDPSIPLFLKAQKISRAALDTAGSALDALHVWIDDWRATEINPSQFRLSADAGNFALDLLLTTKKPPILHGRDGLSQKSTRKGYASHYFSYTRLLTHGVIRIHNVEYPVSGTSWFDKEFSSSMLDTDQVGWDWFSIQFDNDCELMLYLLRHSDASTSYSGGTWVESDGQKIDISHRQFSVIPRREWTSPHTQITYPSGWTIRVPSLNLEIEFLPRTPDQELSFQLANRPLNYWEGACVAQGIYKGKPIRGHGFAELTGYDGMRPLR